MIDLDELRDGQIRFHHLGQTDSVYTFYYDETNNVRKLYVDEDGFNVASPKIFILGGIAHEGKVRAIDISTLRQAMNIQKNVCELKLAHVAKGEFVELLKSEKLAIFLRWIRDDGFIIHYHELDPLYWSVVDIVDSILAKSDHAMLLHYHALLKSDLTAVFRNNLRATAALFHQYGYPGLSAENRIPFLRDLLEFLECSESCLPEFNYFMLKGVLQMGRSLDELAFIEGNPRNLLIENFSAFYLNRIALFRRSDHILDTENSVQEAFKRSPLMCGDKPATNYRFADSKDEAGIQLADVLVGVLGKLHSYLTEASREEVAQARDGLSGTCLENVSLLRDLISSSHDTNVAFLHHVASVHDTDKLDLFLQFSDGRYAG
ncbi:DUF3800 domain-containing protein [Edaphobacter dinghuensis]|uniref:DUF3800 domain-containing protein n=1 Tax=Edaphobacter dinghuensis TaxID=1560005 RepID=A0A917MBL1_9BACT|nr:DUF3800 domain-containing protein [Edaphobacter dinghuensis]GGG87435.1 hypothetical protein GCM10011585_34400 [Edaphobacter dinghuensis]